MNEGRKIDIDALTEAASKPDPLETAVARFNDEYMVVNEAGRALIFYRTTDDFGRLFYQRLRVDDMRTLYANWNIPVLSKKGGEDEYVYVNAFDHWFKHHERRQYLAGVRFAPNSQVEPGVLNLWEGFGCADKPGDWSLMHNHMRDVLCSGNLPQFDYLLKWCGRMVQFPDKLGEVAIVLKGPEGVGKGTLGSALVYLLGQHGMQVTHTAHLTGHFNQHLRDCVMLFADEAYFVGDPRQGRVLNGRITESTLIIEAKFMPVIRVPNYLHVLMASNAEWVVPAGLDARRYFVLLVPSTHMGDLAYFEAIRAQMENGGYEAMLYDLLRLDLSGFNVRKIPDTAGLQDQKKHSLKPELAWWEDVLQQGCVWRGENSIGDAGGVFYADAPGEVAKEKEGNGGFDGWDEKVTTELLYSSYHRFADSQGVNKRDRLAREAFGGFMHSTLGAKPRRLAKAIIGERRSGGVQRAPRPSGYLVGSLVEARKSFEKATGLRIKWLDYIAVFGSMRAGDMSAGDDI